MEKSVTRRLLLRELRRLKIHWLMNLPVDVTGSGAGQDQQRQQIQQQIFHRLDLLKGLLSKSIAYMKSFVNRGRWVAGLAVFLIIISSVFVQARTITDIQSPFRLSEIFAGLFQDRRQPANQKKKVPPMPKKIDSFTELQTYIDRMISELEVSLKSAQETIDGLETGGTKGEVRKQWIEIQKILRETKEKLEAIKKKLAEMAKSGQIDQDYIKKTANDTRNTLIKLYERLVAIKEIARTATFFGFGAIDLNDYEELKDRFGPKTDRNNNPLPESVITGYDSQGRPIIGKDELGYPIYYFNLDQINFTLKWLREQYLKLQPVAEKGVTPPPPPEKPQTPPPLRIPGGQTDSPVDPEKDRLIRDILRELEKKKNNKGGARLYPALLGLLDITDEELERLKKMTPEQQLDWLKKRDIRDLAGLLEKLRERKKPSPSLPPPPAADEKSKPEKPQSEATKPETIPAPEAPSPKRRRQRPSPPTPFVPPDQGSKDEWIQGEMSKLRGDSPPAKPQSRQPEVTVVEQSKLRGDRFWYVVFRIIYPDGSSKTIKVYSPIKDLETYEDALRFQRWKEEQKAKLRGDSPRRSSAPKE